MITFGIITNSQHHSTDQNIRMSIILNSIEQQHIPIYEIIIVGDYVTKRDNITCIPFDETIKKAWITKKKNIITQNAKHDVIVYMHDYIMLSSNWYQGWSSFGYDWDIAMNVITNKDNTRFRDWCVFKYDGNVGANGVWTHTTPKHPPCTVSPYIPPYEYKQTQFMYISGSYWLAKKFVMIEEPLDEDFVWGQPEDIEWSERVIPKYKYVMNTQSTVRLLHQKDPVWSPL